MITLVFGTVLPWLLIAVGTWIGYQLVRQNGRILLRLESIERRFGSRPPAQGRAAVGLTVGTDAPDFELPDLAPNGKQPDPSLARSRLNRDGLKAGARA